MSIDRASIATDAILHVVRMRGTGAEARAEIKEILRTEFADVEHTAANEIRLQDE